MNYKILGRVAIASLLIAQLSSGQARPGSTDSGVRQSVAALSPNAKVELQLVDGSDLRGRVISHSESDLLLKQNGAAGTKTVGYDQVRSISEVKASHSRAKWIIIGAVAGAAVVVAIVAGIVLHSGY